MTDHEHRFDLQLGMSGRGLIFGDYEGYVRRCKCGEYAPDFVAFKERRAAEKLAAAEDLIRESGGYVVTEESLARALYESEVADSEEHTLRPHLTAWDELPPAFVEAWHEDAAAIFKALDEQAAIHPAGKEESAMSPGGRVARRDHGRVESPAPSRVSA